MIVDFYSLAFTRAHESDQGFFPYFHQKKYDKFMSYLNKYQGYLDFADNFREDEVEFCISRMESLYRLLKSESELFDILLGSAFSSSHRDVIARFPVGNIVEELSDDSCSCQ